MAGQRNNRTRQGAQYGKKGVKGDNENVQKCNERKQGRKYSERRRIYFWRGGMLPRRPGRSRSNVQLRFVEAGAIRYHLVRIRSFGRWVTVEYGQWVVRVKRTMAVGDGRAR